MPRYVPLARRGFTLVELLVVIAIISTLMGLLLPAVQNAREASRRNTCANNIGQLAKAAIAYDGSKGALPGWKNRFPNVHLNPPINATVNWPIPLLPHVERNDIYQIIETGSASAGLLTNLSGASLSIPNIGIFQCPSAPVSDDAAGVIAYAGNAGSGLALVSPVNTQAKGDGIFLDRIGVSGAFSAARYSLDSVTNGDGTASTLIFSEKTSNILPKQAVWFTLNGAADLLPWAVEATMLNLPLFGLPGALNEYSPVAKTVNPINVAAVGLLGLPSSTHPSGVVAAYADGHVQYLRDSIDSWVYAQLVTSDTKFNPSPSVVPPNRYYTNSVRANTWLEGYGGTPPYLLNEDHYR